MSPLSVKALCVVIVGTVTSPIRDWLYGKRDAYQNSVWNRICVRPIKIDSKSGNMNIIILSFFLYIYCPVLMNI